MIYQLKASLLVAQIDEEDLPLVDQYKWYAVKDHNIFYAAAHIRVEGVRTTPRMHNLILGAKGIDHIDRDGLNNQRSNLRIATPSQNMANRVSSQHSSQYKGVTFAKRSGNRRSRWQAMIGVNGKNMWLGYFDTEEEAALAYNAAAIEAFGEFALVNEMRWLR